MKHPREYRGQEVVILGLARSGVTVAKLLHGMGAKVTVNDRKERTECPEAEELEALGLRVICGQHPPDLIHDGVKLVIKNPGIPYHIHPLQEAAKRGIEIVTEVEVAGHLLEVPIIGITGSNGKTTTTTLIYEILAASGMKPATAGNIGRAMCELLMETEEDYRWVAAELSSFQLKGTSSFRPKIACLLNFSETHLDYHGTMEDYWTSKKKLFANQESSDYAVLNYDDPACRALAEEIAAETVFFSLTQELDYGVYVKDGMIVYRDQEGASEVIMPLGELGLPGSFNAENALAAAAAAILAGAPAEKIADTLRTFRGVPHRLEFVAEQGGVKYYNNSKATNASAAKKALEAFAEPVVLIAGGLDRGSDYMELVPIFRERVKALVLLGQTKEKLKRVGEQAGIPAIRLIEQGGKEEQIRKAVEAAAALAQPGDVVMLNPACASWDMFASFEERGRMFKESVHNLR